MAKYYEVLQTSATGNGYTTSMALVVNPVIKDGGITATQVGIWDRNFETEQYMYVHCEPLEFMIIGNATCIERKKPFSDLNVK